MLIAICGKSGTGKSSIVNELVKRGYKKVVTDTTRPKRKGEVNEVDYYFDTDEEFDELLEEGEFIEYTQYKVATGDLWRYGTTRGAIRECGENAVIVLNPNGIQAFKDQGIEMMTVHVVSNEKVILFRLEQRGDLKSEILRRMETDNEDFKNIHELVDFEVVNDKNTTISDLADMIINLTKDMEQ